MKIPLFRRLSVECLLPLCCFLPISFLQANDSTLIAFRLKDQFHREYTAQSWPEKILVFIGSDKDGSKYTEHWGKAIDDSLKSLEGYEGLRFIGLSDLRGVPFFLKGYVRGKFPKEKERRVLLDWKGKFPKTYDFKPKCTNILIFDHHHRLIYKTYVRELQPEKLAVIINTLKSLLAGREAS